MAETEESTVEEIQGEVLDDSLESLFEDRTPLDEMDVELEPSSTSEETKDVEVAEPSSEEPIKEETKPETEPVQESDSEVTTGLLKALQAERKLRQDLENRIKPEPEPEKEFDWSDPQKHLAEMETKLDQKYQSKFLAMSESLCEARHDDFQDKKAVFFEMAQANPAIVNTMVVQADPAEYAYKLAEQEVFRREVAGDPETFRAKIRAEERAKLEDEFNKKVNEKVQIATSLPPTAKSMGDKTTPSQTINNNPMDSLFPGEIPGG
jgi:hypothetical protein